MLSDLEIVRLTTVEEMLPSFPLIRLLSPQLTAGEYEKMLRDMVPHNYFQAAIYLDEACVAVSGYWIGTKLYSGKYIEIDNFIVHPDHRSKNFGKRLQEWILAEGKANGCVIAMLDAYVENFRAHHFYYREGFIARGFHYLKTF